MKNDIVKAVVGVYILGSKVNDVVKIEDVKGYYSERLTQLNSEIQIKGKGISPVEQFLLDKFNAEIGYCNIALFKAGTTAYIFYSSRDDAIIVLRNRIAII